MPSKLFELRFGRLKVTGFLDGFKKTLFFATGFKWDSSPNGLGTSVCMCLRCSRQGKSMAYYHNQMCILYHFNDETDWFISSSISCRQCHLHSNLINMDVIVSSEDLNPLPLLVKDQHLMIWTELALNSINVRDVLELTRERYDSNLNFEQYS